MHKLINNEADFIAVQLTDIMRIDFSRCFNPLACKGNYSATLNNMKLVYWPFMGGLLHLVQQGGDWVGPQPAQAPSRCTKCDSPPINGPCTNPHTAV